MQVSGFNHTVLIGPIACVAGPTLRVAKPGLLGEGLPLLEHCPVMARMPCARRGSMALNSLTPAEKLATFTASPPLSSGTVLPNPGPTLTSTMDQPLIACPEPAVRTVFSYNHDLNHGATY